MTAPQPGVLFTGSYLKGNSNPGVPGGPSVFDTLAFPPVAGASAQAEAEENMAALGTVAPPSAIIKSYMVSNSDPIKNTHDDAGVQKGPITG